MAQTVKGELIRRLVVLSVRSAAFAVLVRVTRPGPGDGQTGGLIAAPLSTWRGPRMDERGQVIRTRQRFDMLAERGG